MISTIADNTRVAELVIITEYDLIITPKASHSKTPMINRMYIYSDIPFVSFSFTDFITCGIRDTVVQIPAKRPTISCIGFGFSQKKE
jgi:hypothetical protein